MKTKACFFGMLLLLIAGVACAEPVGTVIDWWRPDPSWPVPAGYQICDGSIVTDASSPLFNIAIPDLRDKFVVGVVDPANIGSSGGSSAHSHSLDINHLHGSFSTSTGGGHAHIVDLPSYTAAGYTAYAGDHNHPWLDTRIQPDGKTLFITYNQDGSSQPVTIWDNGISNAGSGIYPLAIMNRVGLMFYTQWSGGHQHSVGLSHDHPALSSGTSGTHAHNFSIPALGTFYRDTSTNGSLPPYFGLLKIMRIL